MANARTAYAKTEEETIEGVHGIRFRTNAEPNTEAERQLQEIQSVLSGGIVDLPPPALPHLNFYWAAVAGGPDPTYISLWAPNEQRLQATQLLEAAGFTITVT
jgi:hypothetical protein